MAPFIILGVVAFGLLWFFCWVVTTEATHNQSWYVDARREARRRKRES